MINSRGKQCKSQTPTRNHQTIGKLPHFAAVNKQNDPFLKQLREVYNKENNDPNIKEVDRPSIAQKIDHQNRKLSPSKSIINDRNIPTKNININASLFSKTLKNISQLSSNSKLSNLSTEKQKKGNNIKSGSRNSTEKDEPHVNNFLDKYFSVKQEGQNSKKMKVTLKDIKKERKQIHETQKNTLAKSAQQIRRSIQKQIFSSVRNQNLRNQPTVVSEKTQQYNYQTNKEEKCFNHPQKRASHRLLDDKNQQKAFCQKCSVNLVTKGHQMAQIIQLYNKPDLKPKEIRDKRLQKLQNFITDIDKLGPMFQQSKEDLMNFKSFVDEKYKLEESKAHLYYQRIRQEIDSSHQKTLFNLKIFYNSVIQELDQNQKKLEDNYHNIKIIKEDILPNMSSIIEEKQINQQSFQKIIEDYNQKLKSIAIKIKQISQTKYLYYEYKYSKSNSLIAEMQRLINLDIIEQNMISGQQLNRVNHLNLGEAQELFRISFGKVVQSPQLKLF